MYSFAKKETELDNCDWLKGTQKFRIYVTLLYNMYCDCAIEKKIRGLRLLEEFGTEKSYCSEFLSEFFRNSDAV